MDWIWDKTAERLKIDSAQINSVRKAGLSMYESLSLAWDTEKGLLSILTDVHIKRVNFRENIYFELFVGTNETP